MEAAVEVVSEVVEEDEENGFLFNSFASDDVEDVVLIEAVSEEPEEDVRRVKGLEGILSNRSMYDFQVALCCGFVDWNGREL